MALVIKMALAIFPYFHYSIVIFFLCGSEVSFARSVRFSKGRKTITEYRMEGNRDECRKFRKGAGFVQ